MDALHGRSAWTHWLVELLITLVELLITTITLGSLPGCMGRPALSHQQPLGDPIANSSLSALALSLSFHPEAITLSCGAECSTETLHRSAAHCHPSTAALTMAWPVASLKPWLPIQDQQVPKRPSSHVLITARRSSLMALQADFSFSTLILQVGHCCSE
jgi:hypothetical protein